MGPDTESRHRRDSTVDAGAAWLGAYAAGLAYSDLSDTECTALLVDAAEDGAQALRLAHRRLLDLSAMPPAVHRRARRLLQAASDAAEPNGHACG